MSRLGAIDIPKEPPRWKECYYCKEFYLVAQFYSAKKCNDCQEKHTRQRKARQGTTHEELDKKRDKAAYQDPEFEEFYRQHIASGEIITDRRAEVVPHLR